MPKVVPPKNFKSCLRQVTQEHEEAGPLPAEKTPVVELRSGEGESEKKYPHEWNVNKRVRMKDIPTTVLLTRTDKATYYMSSTIDVRMLFSHLIAERRKAINRHMDTASIDAAAECYVPHNCQAPIRHALDDWYRANVASVAGSGWQKFIERGCPGDRAYAQRSHFKTWTHKTFGCPFIFDFFVAFGTIDEAMVGALSQAMRQRARTTAEAGFAPYGHDIVASASSRDNIALSRLSPINRARVMGLPEPEVQGKKREHSLASQMRQIARDLEDDMKKKEFEEDNYVKQGGMWMYEHEKERRARSEATDEAWKEATKLSIAAGHTFTGRWGKRHYISKESLVATAVRLYFINVTRPGGRTWQVIPRLLGQYQRKRRLLPGVPEAASAKAARRTFVAV